MWPMTRDRLDSHQTIGLVRAAFFVPDAEVRARELMTAVLTFPLSVDVCMFEASYEKPTMLLASFPKISGLMKGCDGRHLHMCLQGKAPRGQNSIFWTIVLAKVCSIMEPHCIAQHCNCFCVSYTLYAPVRLSALRYFVVSGFCFLVGPTRAVAFALGGRPLGLIQRCGCFACLVFRALHVFCTVVYVAPGASRIFVACPIYPH